MRQSKHVPSSLGIQQFHSHHKVHSIAVLVLSIISHDLPQQMEFQIVVEL